MSDDELRKMSKPTTLLELLDFRDYTYSVLTDDATRLFSAKLTDAVNAFLHSTVPINWQHVERITSLDGFVRVIGSSIPAIGEIIKVEDEHITITPDNATHYTQLARFVLPTTMLESGTSLQIFQFIKDVTAISSLISDAELEHVLREYILDDTIELTSQPAYISMMDKITKPSDVLGFDTDTLTDAQIKSLHMFDKLVPGNKH